MNEYQAVDAIHAFFAAGWNGLTPVIHDDEKKDHPKDATWVRLNVRHVDADQRTIGAPGANRHEQLGTITIQIFQPIGFAGQDARAKAVTAAAIFRGKNTQGIKFYRVSQSRGDPDGRGFFQINVNISFRYSIYA